MNELIKATIAAMSVDDLKKGYNEIGTGSQYDRMARALITDRLESLGLVKWDDDNYDYVTLF